MQTLLIATRNGHKTREIGQMLGSGWDVRDLLSLPHAPNIEETGATFEENAALKALTISRIFTGLSFLAGLFRATCGWFELPISLPGAWAAVGSFMAITPSSSKVSKTC